MAIDKPLIIRKIKDIDTISDGVIKGLEKSLSKFEKLLLANSETLKAANSAEIALAKENIKRLLVESGYYKEVGVLINDKYAETINSSHDMYKSMYKKSFRFSEKSLNELNITKQLNLDQFNMLADKATTQLTQGIIELQYGTATQSEIAQQLISTVENVTATIKAQASTQVNTGLQGFFRQSNVKLADDAGINKYEYVGPDDEITRDFCVAHLGKVRTLEEWDSLSNGQLSPVSTFGGGYNCRHQLVAVE